MATCGRPARRAAVTSRRHTHSRTSSGSRLQSVGEARHIGRHDEEAGRAGGWAARRRPTCDTARWPDRRPQLHGGQHRAHRSPSNAPAGRPARRRTPGRRRDRSRATSPWGLRCRRSRGCPWPGCRRRRWPGPGPRPAPGIRGRGGLAHGLEKESPVLDRLPRPRPGATAAISMGAPVAVMGRPVSSATWSSATWASSSNWIRSAGSTLPSGSPPLATPWASVRARSIRAPPGDAPPMSWSRSPRICSRKLPPPPGPGNATPAHRRRGPSPIRSTPDAARSASGGVGQRHGDDVLARPRSTWSCTDGARGTVYRRSWRSATESTRWVSTPTTTSPGSRPAFNGRASGRMLVTSAPWLGSGAGPEIGAH